MVLPGSAPTRAALPAPLGLLAMVAGVWAMLHSATIVRGQLPVSASIVLAEALLILPGLALLVLWRIPLARGLALRPPETATTLLALAAGVALWSVGLGVMQLQYVAWQPPPGYLEAFRRLHAALRPEGAVDEVVSVLAIAVAPGVCEEVLFRGVLLPSLVCRLRPAGAVLLSALLFGAIHVDAAPDGGLTAYRVPFALAVGLGLGALRVSSRGLLAPVLAHATLNTVTFEAARVLDTGAEDQPAPVLGAALLAAGLLGFLAARQRLARLATEPSNGPGTPAVEP
jgi:membrane protease YdiL (CAAX protease family)